MKKVLTILKWLFLSLFITGTSLYFYQDIETKELNPETRKLLGRDFIQTKRGYVHYQLKGDENAELVVLVHGYGVASYLWEPTLQFLIKQGYRVLSFDLFGHGFSDRPNEEYGLKLFSGQLKDLLDELELNQSFHLLGLSMGGTVVTRFSNQYPDRLLSLILQDPLVNQIDPSKIRPLAVPGIGDYLFAVYLMPIYIERHKNEPRLGPLLANLGDSYREQAQYKGFRRALLSMLRFMAKHHYIKEYQQLAQTKMPKLLIWGSDDPTIPISESDILRKLMPNMVFKVIEGGGHEPSKNKPEEFNAILLEFLKKHPQQATETNAS